MPELPEVEAARRAIEENCLGKKIIKSIIADDSKVVDGVSPSDFQASLDGKTIVAARRKGKNMWLQLDSPPFPSFQFGMAGAIYIKGVAVTKYKRSQVNDTDEWPSKYSKFFIQLDDGLELSFTDKRRFAKVRLLKDPTSVLPISGLGPDALLEPMTVDEFAKSLSKKKIGIKALLLDQSYIAGIGNWIADEVLYQARIHPMQTASSLSKENCQTLHKCIKEVIEYAVEVDADCSRFPFEWLFHFRWGKKSGKVNGKKIEFITAGGRTTAFVPELQKLPKDQEVKMASGKTKRKSSEGDEEEAENEEGNPKDNTLKNGQGKSKGKAKKAVTRSKSDVNDSEADDEEEAESPKNKKLKNGQRKGRGKAKKVVAKRKPDANDSEADDDGDNDDNEEVKKADNGKQSGEASKKKLTARQTSMKKKST